MLRVEWTLGLAFLLLAANLGWAQDAYYKERLKMVEQQVEREGIRSEVVLRAMRDTQRHQFVRQDLRAKAYLDEILPIGHKQTLSTAYIVAYMTEAIDPQPTDKVLEIGTGSGYQAAVLSKLVKEVYTIEIVEPLGKEAADRLQKLGYKNVFVKVGDGFKGWPEHAPFDKIIVTCSPEAVPQPLLDQLKVGGKLIIPLGQRYSQAFYLFEKKYGMVDKTKLLPTLFVPMTGQAEANRAVKLDPVHPRLANGNFELTTRDAANMREVPDAWFYLRQAEIEHKGAKEGKNYLTFNNREPGRDSHVLQALAIDGSRIRSVRLSVWVKAEDAQVGGQKGEAPGLDIRFYDEKNRVAGFGFLGAGLGTFKWTRREVTVTVPRETKTSLIQLGLRGGTGQVSVDDVRLTPSAR